MWFEYFEERLPRELIESVCVFITDYHSAGIITTLKGFVEDNGKLLKSDTRKPKNKTNKIEECLQRKSCVSFTRWKELQNASRARICSTVFSISNR